MSDVADVVIVKVQTNTSPSGMALVYARGHDRMQQQRISRLHLRQMRYDAKGYFTATWSDGKWHLIERVEAQPW